jgi:hypothetical protein
VWSIFASKERHKKEVKHDDKEKGEKEVSTNL